MQLIDELAMIYTVLISLFATFSYDRSPWLQWSIFVALTTTGVTITSVYHYLHEPLFHQNAFALLMITLLGNGFYKMETIVKHTNPKARILLWQIVGWGSVIFLSAFALWNLDNAYCTELRRMRRNIGMPWGFFLGMILFIFLNFSNKKATHHFCMNSSPRRPTIKKSHFCTIILTLNPLRPY